MHHYRTFVLMLIISFLIMYGVMFLNVDQVDHIYLSMTRLNMSLLMVSPMALLMMATMRKMYPDRKLNTTITILSILIFSFSLILLRTQTPIGDRQYMKAMIPHHSSAMMTSSHANLKDPRVKQLSESIITSQQKEIAEMKAMLEKIK